MAGADLVERRGVRAWRLGGRLLGVVLVLVLASCQTAPPPPAPAADPDFDQAAELEALNLPVNESLRVRFLPPIAKKNPTGSFVSGLDLEIKFFNVNPVTGVASGSALSGTLSTAKRTIVSQRDTYATIWLALGTTLDRKATQYLRAEIRTAGAGNAPVCNGTSQDCLGYLDIFAFKGLFLGRQNVPDGFVPVPSLLGVLPIGFKVLAAPVVPEEPVGGPPPATLGELTGLSGGTLDEQAGNCASSFLTRPGQGLQAVGAGLQAVGAVGGLFQGQTSSFNGTLVSPAQIGDELYGQFLNTGNSKRSVIFVVDDFSNGFELPAAALQPGTDLATLTGQISHGTLVLHHVLEILASMDHGTGNDVYQISQGAFDGQPYYEYSYLGTEFFVQAVNVGQFDTDTIADRLREAMLHYGEVEGASIMVVNMSFAIVPCSVLSDYSSTSGLATFEAYLGALAAHNHVGSEYLDQLDELVSTPVGLGSDPLLAFTGCPLPSTDGLACDGTGLDGANPTLAITRSLYLVASSGNYGNSYSLYPAAATNVVSVGSLAAAAGGYSAAGYSNLAGIAAPGGLFELASGGGNTVAYAGTSFAAPIVSLFLGIDGMSNSPVCGETPPGAAPELAPGGTGMVPFYGSGGALAQGCHP